MRPLLSVRGLTHNFGAHRVLDSIDLDVNEGEIVGLIGPNGSGKTTLFHCVSGFYRPDAGSISLDTGAGPHELVGLPPDRIRHLGLARTFQTREIFGGRTILENLMTGMHSKLSTGLLGALLQLPKTRKEEAQAFARAVEVMAMFPGRFGPERWNQYAESLSFANRCRLEIAICMMAGPKIILVDEPAAGMNPVERVEIVETLRRIRDLGFTLMLVEHNMRVIMGISDRIVVFDRGRKIADGKPDEVIVDPAVTEAYLGDEYDIA